MSKNLFDHIKGVTLRKVKWEDLSEEDIKSWNNYMITKFFSMEIELVEVMNDIQKYTNGILTPKDYYKLLYDLLPKHSFFLKYVKSKTRVDIDMEFINVFCKHYELGKNEVYRYIKMLKNTNPNELVEVLKRYGLKENDIELFEKQLKNVK
jgi:hypothetical protein